MIDIIHHWNILVSFVFSTNTSPGDILREKQAAVKQAACDKEQVDRASATTQLKKQLSGWLDEVAQALPKAIIELTDTDKHIWRIADLFDMGREDTVLTASVHDGNNPSKPRLHNFVLASEFDVTELDGYKQISDACKAMNVSFSLAAKRGDKSNTISIQIDTAYPYQPSKPAPAWTIGLKRIF